MRALVLAALIATAASSASALPATVDVDIRSVLGYPQVAASGESGLYVIAVNASTGLGGTAHPDYVEPPYLLKLRGSRYQIGWDYAELTAERTSFTYNTFLGALTNNDTVQQAKLAKFFDWLWDTYYSKHVPSRFLTEIGAMKDWVVANPGRANLLQTTPDVVTQRFNVMANMPADGPNIIAALERELERGWPTWLKEIVNDIVKILEKYIKSCDSYGVWGPRTQNGRLYTSRNLDYNPDTGIDRFKLLVIYDVHDGNSSDAPRKRYASMGYTFGMGALAGQNFEGVTTSEMNLDNSETTFSGVPFPMRLRYVLEEAHDLRSAMTVWNATNNTNSFNFLIGSAADGEAYALETIFNFTAVFPADSPVEAASTYDCGVPPKVDPTCAGWAQYSNQTTGNVSIGWPLPHAVWRTNHGMSPVVLRTQEPLFYDTVYRYRLMHELFAGYEASATLIDDVAAVRIVATLGEKGDDFFHCTPPFRGASNILSVAYVPGEQRAFIAWEAGHQATWRPSACAPYVAVNLTQWWI